MPELDFELTVRDVFVLTDRGVVVASGDAQGVLRSGATVQVWQGDRLLGTSPAFIEFHARPGMVAIALIAPGVQVQPGCRITAVTP